MVVFVLMSLITCATSTFTEPTVCRDDLTCFDPICCYEPADSWRGRGHRATLNLGCFANNYPWCDENSRQIPPPSKPRLVEVTGYYCTRYVIHFQYLWNTKFKIKENTEFEKIPFNAKLPTIFLVHGYLNDITGQWLHDLKDALLKIQNYNVFIIGWKPYDLYWKEVSNTRVAARQILRLFLYLKEYRKLNPETVTLIGHSLGAHIMSYVGKEYNHVKASNEPMIGHIIGLDPAGPCFTKYTTDIRLHKGDAQFVQAIHTNAGLLGITEPSGDVDIYMNGGSVQPACNSKTFANSINKFFNGKCGGSCDHGMAHIYFLETLTKGCKIWACRCDRHNHVCIPLGLKAAQIGEKGTFKAITPSKKPFCNKAEDVCNDSQPLIYSYGFRIDVCDAIKNVSMFCKR